MWSACPSGLAPLGGTHKAGGPSRAFLTLGLAEGHPGREVECPLCPHVSIQPLLLCLLQVLPTWQSQAVPVPVGSPAGRRLSPPTPQATAPARPSLGASGGGPDMHFVSASQLPYTALAAGLPRSTVLVPRSSCLPLCFLMQPPLGFLLIPVYSLFYKSL